MTKKLYDNEHQGTDEVLFFSAPYQTPIGILKKPWELHGLLAKFDI